MKSKAPNQYDASGMILDPHPPLDFDPEAEAQIADLAAWWGGLKPAADAAVILETETVTDQHACPQCKADAFGYHNGVPVTTGGWHGGLRFAWGQYAGVHMPCCTGKRCEECGYTESVDPDFD